METGVSERVREKLQALTEQFINSLPEKLEHLRLVILQLEDDSSAADETFRERTRNEFHKISGMGASFGFRDIAEKAREVEQFLAECLNRGSEAAGDADVKYLSDMYCALAKVCDKMREDFLAGVSPPQQQDIEVEGEFSRYLCLYKSDLFFTEESRDHLKVFGFTVLSINSLAAVRQFLCEGKTVVLILDAGTFRDEQEAQDILRSFYPGEESSPDPAEIPGGGDLLKVVYLCEWDDFDTRLFAVRTCGNVFVPAPFDVPYLIDKIDSLLHNKEEQPYHILIVNDEPEKVALCAMVLQNAGMITSVALDPRNVISVLIESKPDLVLMELDMVECSGSELAALIRQQEAFVGIPVVFLSTERNEKKQLLALQHGADDFLVEPIEPDFLAATLAVRVERTRRLRYYMERDSLTSLYNHSQLIKRLADDLSRSRRIGSKTCYAMIDIDHFKQVNDNYGHLTGDRVIKALSQMLVERLRKTDTVGRYGGEEFGVILFNTDINSGEILMNEIRESFAKIHHREAKHDFFVTFSCGITEARPEDAVVIIKEQADKALYRAKRDGRNQVVRYTEDVMKE
ncbi:MAG: diguanylate cyclase [Spirochaetales bacterium]|jgi:diguanylate cyclase (GGDEF)-like protein|nr:diguanylate cyclase [Spirochaetales bacterium]